MAETLGGSTRLYRPVVAAWMRVAHDSAAAEYVNHPAGEHNRNKASGNGKPTLTRRGPITVSHLVLQRFPENAHFHALPPHGAETTSQPNEDLEQWV